MLATSLAREGVHTCRMPFEHYNPCLLYGMLHPVRQYRKPLHLHLLRQVLWQMPIRNRERRLSQAQFVLGERTELVS
jgi:hypothetical protein